MLEGALNALKIVLSLKENERVLVVTDDKKKAIGEAFYQASKQLGAKPKIYILPSERPLKDIPSELQTIIQNNHVIVNAFEGFADETPFRIKLIKKEIAGNARVGHAPGITEDMMLKGAMTADYKDIANKAEMLMNKFRNANQVKIAAPSGTDIALEIGAREFESDVKIKPGSFGNLPAGEIWCAPHEGSARGIIVCDGSIGDLGQVRKNLKIEVRNGKIVALDSEDVKLVDRVKELISIDEEASVIGELGIGLNQNARLSGNLLEDEKAGGTAHIAFGNNENMPGGKNRSKTHRDFLFYKPTIEVLYGNRKKKIVIKDGLVV